MALLSFLVERTSSSCSVIGRLDNRTLPLSQHKENCGLLLFDFANRSIIHIFALQNPQIVSIFPQSHCVEANKSSSPNNCNVSLPKEGCACVVACCTVRCFWCRRLFCSCGVSDGPSDSIRCLARRSLYKQLQCSSVDSNVSWSNSAGAWNKSFQIARDFSTPTPLRQHIINDHVPSSQYYLSTFQHHHVD
jgi:hypothetical protein